LGLFAAGSHRVVDIPHCAVHHPLINEVAGEIKQLLREQRVPPYSETAHAGLIRYLQLVVALADAPVHTELASDKNGDTGKSVSQASIQLVVVANCETSAPLKDFLDALVQRLGRKLHSLFFNGQTDPGNAILGPIWERHAGPECVREPSGGAFVFYPPGAFGQASPELFEAIVQRVHSWVPADSRVTELFSGVGAIGLGLVKNARQVCFNERSAEGLHGLRLGINALPEALTSRVTVEPGPAEALGAAFHQDGVLIVDPPRRGLDSELLRGLCRTPVSRLIYVSCGLDSFLRDAEQLTQSYTCTKLYGYALFPFTEHVETVACFVRNPG
jgi:tRNA/tmRNA/rRNA uracil-C5-methylase (TrmA/RlmC/RlmD family)